MPPKLIARNADRQGGVLSISAATRANSARGSPGRLKLEIRRLPPGLTLAEFEEILGDEWRLGNGKVDWREFRPGKTRAPGSGKVPEQSRCFIHVVNDTCVKDFEKRFLEVVFHDKAGTHKNPDLKNLQPTIGFAPNQKTPLQQPKPRLDNRQGTIDQDPEFIAFLESETQPITKPAALDSLTLDKEGEKKEVKTTPLIEDLREKKANKAKTAQAKAEKAEKDKKSQAVKAPTKDTPAAEKEAGKALQQQKVEQAAKDAATALNKQVAAKQQPQAQQPKVAPPAKLKKSAPSPKSQNVVPAATQPPATTSSTPNPTPQRGPTSQRQRGNTDGIKKMLQKDLGIKPKSTPSPQPATAAASTPTTSSPTPASTATPSTATSTTSITAPPTLSSEIKALPVKAYLKHANPSQGMTEILIQQALSSYGEVANVTIDPRKGTAIAVFKQNEGLKKALEAKRVPVANGAVEVLEFRDRPASGSISRGGFRGGRGGRGGSRGGAQGGTATSMTGSGVPDAAPTQGS